MTDTIAQVIADRFYESFADELHEWLFAFKTEASLEDQTIIGLAEAAVCAANDVTYDDYLNELGRDYDEIFQPSTEICDAAIMLMLKRYAE